MDFNEVLTGRRSIRKYKEGAITKEQIEELIKAAQAAPTWKNSQTGRFYVVLSDEKKKEFAEKCLPPFNQKNTENAAAYIVTTFVSHRSGFEKTGEPTNELGDEWGAMDLGLQEENLVLKAYEMGFGSLIMGVRDGQAIREFFDIPEIEHVGAVISVGLSDIAPEAPKRRDLEQILKVY
jgi:nitroreductase